MHRGGIFGAVAVAAVFLAACSLATTGGLHRSREATERFEAFAAQANYRYWYLNQENNPFGVVGLERGYRLDEDPMWHAVEADSDVFRKVVALVQAFPVPGSYASGFVITDPNGRQIGVWYSSIGAGITVNPQTGIVSISTTLPWVFNDEF